MIFIGIGANLHSPRHGSPLETCLAALEIMEKSGLRIARRSRWRASAPAPASDQPWYVNGVVEIETETSPAAIMDVLHGIETQCGRPRGENSGERNAARTLDLDLLAFHDLVLEGNAPDSIILPHPRMHERAFVLEPLAELSPDWAHPVTGKGVKDLIAALPPGQDVTLLEELNEEGTL